MRRAPLLALLAAFAATPAAASNPPTLLCAREEVLRIVDRTIRAWNRYNRVEEDTAVEAPTSVANAVVCHATMTTIGYVQTAEGWVALPVRQVRRYDVQIINNRLHVQVAP